MHHSYTNFNLSYKVANILVNPTHPATTVWPIPQNNAYNGGSGYRDALYTKATAAELRTPDVSGNITPIIIINNGKNL